MRRRASLFALVPVLLAISLASAMVRPPSVLDAPRLWSPGGQDVQPIAPHRQGSRTQEHEVVAVCSWGIQPPTTVT